MSASHHPCLRCESALAARDKAEREAARLRAILIDDGLDPDREKAGALLAASERARARLAVELADARAEIARLRRGRTNRDLDEAVNSRDGSYRP